MGESVTISVPAGHVLDAIDFGFRLLNGSGVEVTVTLPAGGYKIKPFNPVP
ncbi:MAG TPA: hypothetical protein VNZ52_17020 [Candidatus Thermoplasmatota archaeon]|nr:hypothetical protein [Candidatus Thermoplasmatota archaeon]